MSPRPSTAGRPSQRLALVALAACCIGPMLAIIVLTSVLGVALGPSVAAVLGITAAAICVTVMVLRHRGHAHGGPDSETRDH